MAQMVCRKLASLRTGLCENQRPRGEAFFFLSALSLCGDRPLPDWVRKWAADQAIGAADGRTKCSVPAETEEGHDEEVLHGPEYKAAKAAAKNEEGAASH